MTYKQLVNNVLVRLREREISNVSDNKLIGTLVNDAKYEVENAWNWSSLRQTLTLTTSANVFN